MEISSALSCDGVLRNECVPWSSVYFTKNWYLKTKQLIDSNG
jgi:hypothetical protein